MIRSFPVFLSAGLLALAQACTSDDALDANLSQRFFLEHDGANMPVTVEGNTASKTLIVMVHGGPGGNGQFYNNEWDFFTDPLEERFGVVYWDQRASGSSTGEFDESLLTIDQMVLDLEALVDLLEYRFGDDIAVFLMGQSYGGTLGSAFLTKGDNQMRINGWINVAGATDWPAYGVEVRDRLATIAREQIALGRRVEDYGRVLAYCESIADLTETTLDMDGDLNGYAYEIRPWLVDDGVVARPPDGRSSLRNALFTNFDPLLALQNADQVNGPVFDSFEDDVYDEALRGVRTPALYISGEYDAVVPKAIVRRAFEAHGGPKEYLNLLRSSHSPMANEPEEFLDAMIGFVEQYD